MLPKVSEYGSLLHKDRKLIILAEGFEQRSMEFVKDNNCSLEGSDVIICRYSPPKKSHFDKLKSIVVEKVGKEPIILEYEPFEPSSFENKINRLFGQGLDKYDTVVIDISVMSKLLIMILLNELSVFNKKVIIIYTEPQNWGPQKEDYEKAILNRAGGSAICLSSVGVGDIVRTSSLSSVIMQNCPTIMFAGLSFNEQLVSLLVNENNPDKLILINQKCSRIRWREDAIKKIHSDIINE